MQTVRFKYELECNITIKLGYVNARIYKADPAASPAVEGGKEGEDAIAMGVPGTAYPMYTSRGSSHTDTFPKGTMIIISSPVLTINRIEYIVSF